MSRKPLNTSFIAEINQKMKPHPQFVTTQYTNADGSTFADLIMVQEGKVHEAWDFSSGKASEKTMTAEHPDFKFKGWDIARFIEETFNHPNHPHIAKIEIDTPVWKVTILCNT